MVIGIVKSTVQLRHKHSRTVSAILQITRYIVKFIVNFFMSVDSNIILVNKLKNKIRDLWFGIGKKK